MRGLTLEDGLAGGVWFITASGYLDANTAEDLDNLIEAVFRQGVYRLALDLGAVTFMSSAGAGVLMAAYKQATAGGGGLAFLSPSEQVAAVFKSLGLEEIFTIVSSRERASAALA